MGPMDAARDKSQPNGGSLDDAASLSETGLPAGRAPAAECGAALSEEETARVEKAKLAEAALRSQGVDGCEKALYHLCGEFPEYMSSNGSEQLERVMREAMLHNEKGNMTFLLNLVADLYVDLPRGGRSSFSTWSHSLCHNFEKYGGERRGASLLDFASNFEFTGRLVEEAAKRAVACGDLGCMERIIGPLASFNLDQINLDHLESDFRLKPRALEAPAFLDLLGGKAAELSILLCRSRGPEEFLIEIAKRPEILEKQVDPARFTAIIEAVKEELSPAELLGALSAVSSEKSNPNSLEIIRQNIAAAEQAHQVERGMFVDVGGTLITNDGSLDEHLLRRMRSCWLRGGRVVIFTAGDPSEATRRLDQLGVEADFLPVRAKSEFHGKILGSLIDDTKPEYQGFSAREYESTRRGW